MYIYLEVSTDDDGNEDGDENEDGKNDKSVVLKRTDDRNEGIYNTW
jgi:hypothetical protein